MEHYRALWDVTECYGSIADRYVMQNCYGKIDYTHTAQNANDIMASPI